MFLSSSDFIAEKICLSSIKIQVRWYWETELCLKIFQMKSDSRYLIHMSDTNIHLTDIREDRYF